MWAKLRFGDKANGLSEEEFLTQSRNRLYDRLIEISREAYPAAGHDEIDGRIEAAFEGTRVSDSDDAGELSNWARETLKLEIDPAALTG